MQIEHRNGGEEQKRRNNQKENHHEGNVHNHRVPLEEGGEVDRQNVEAEAPTQEQVIEDDSPVVERVVVGFHPENVNDDHQRRQELQKR